MFTSARKLNQSETSSVIVVEVDLVIRLVLFKQYLIFLLADKNEDIEAVHFFRLITKARFLNLPYYLKETKLWRLLVMPIQIQ